MLYNKNWGKPGKSPDKRKSAPQQNDPLKRGPFKLTPAHVRFFEANIFNKKNSFSKPKSAYRHGVRVFFAECDPYLVKEIAELSRNTFLKHTAAHSRLDKGYFDFAFSTAADADEAANLTLQVGNRFVPSIRTRYAKDTNILIRFEDLPCTIHRKLLLNFIRDGLSCYGQVVELELNRDPLFPDSSNSRGYAIIEPLPNIKENINLIPRIAHFVEDFLVSPSFKVIPDQASLACDMCKNIGHSKNACPDQLLKLLKKHSEADEESENGESLESYYNDNGSFMGEEVDGDRFLDGSENFSQTSDEATDITESYPWGDFASYKIVEPTTKEQRREAHKKAQVFPNCNISGTQTTSEETTIPENDVPLISNEIANTSEKVIDIADPIMSDNNLELNDPMDEITHSQVEQVARDSTSTPSQPTFTQVENPFGEVPFRTIRNPRGAGCKSRSSKTRKGAGRPRKYIQLDEPNNIDSIVTPEINQDNITSNQSLPLSLDNGVYTQSFNPENNIQSKCQHDPAYATHQYLSEPNIFEPSTQDFVSTLERDPHGDTPSQY